MALFLFAQLYIRQNQMQFTLDVWPASPAEAGAAAGGDATSPARRVPHNNSGAQPGGMDGADTHMHVQGARAAP
jgi:hypothetical protein